MKSLRSFDSLYIHRDPVDMRMGISGLSVIVTGQMRLDIKSCSVFIFTNRRKNLMKILYFDRSGFAVWCKRLEESTFSWPRKFKEEVVTITQDDMELLLEGINIWTRHKNISFSELV